MLHCNAVEIPFVNKRTFQLSDYQWINLGYCANIQFDLCFYVSPYQHTHKMSHINGNGFSFVAFYGTKITTVYIYKFVFYCRFEEFMRCCYISSGSGLQKHPSQPIVILLASILNLITKFPVIGTSKQYIGFQLRW